MLAFFVLTWEEIKDGKLEVLLINLMFVLLSVVNVFLYLLMNQFI